MPPAIFWSVILAGAGFLVGEYAPFTSDLAQIAEPFSPIRNQVAMGYSIVGGILGLVVPARKLAPQ